ncbi:MAG: hypothetical protein GC162_05580 [Planctomycetes bacterium]|nr:hypothetical protein [Planctomycetota bacterium]
MLNRTHLLAVACLAIVSMTRPGFAVPLTIANPSFESPLAFDIGGFFVNPDIDDWTVVEDPDGFATGVFANVPSDQPGFLSNMDGDQAAFMGLVSAFSISQTLADTYQVGSQYKLTAAVAVSLFQPPAAGAKLNMTLFYLDGMGAAQDIDTLAIDLDQLSSAMFTDEMLTIDVLAGDPWAGRAIGIRFQPGTDSGGNLDLDNVRLDVTSVPEPIGALSLGIGALALLRRRSHRA